ncbi:diguanylate cyclase domain-containing protein [Pseudomonadota bacterium]
MATIDANTAAEGDDAQLDIIHEMSTDALSHMLDALSDMVCVCMDGNIRHINTPGLAILGASAQDDLLGVSFQSLICDDFAASTDDILSVIAAETDPTPMRIKGLSGEISSLAVCGKALPELGPNAYMVTAHNLTRQLELSQAVRDSEARFGKLVDSALDFICVLENNLITYVNQAGLNLLKAAVKDEVVGKPLCEFMHADYQGIMDGDIHELVDEGNDLIPLRFVDISQNNIDVEVGITVITDGVTPRYMLEARDITAHNRAVTDLRQSIETLEQRVEERTRELQDEVMERRRAEEMLRHVASHDGLTDLPNRSLLMDRLDKAIHRAHRDDKKCAVMFIDLDGFKPVNDTLGHEKGDLLLRGVAGRLAASVRETDTAARFGGDEFVLVLTDLAKTDDVRPVAKKMLKALAQPFDLDGSPANIGASIGIALYPDHGEKAEEILKQADIAMYDVKGSGKNDFVVAGDRPMQLPGQDTEAKTADALT